MITPKLYPAPNNEEYFIGRGDGMTAEALALTRRGLTQSFGDRRVLDGVDPDLRRGDYSPRRGLHFAYGTTSNREVGK